MNKRLFDIVVIIAIALFLLLFLWLDLLEKLMPFLVIIILAFYFLGQYTERKFKK